MARGGLSYGGIGAKNVTFEAGAALKAIVNTAGKTRDDIVGLPVVMTNVNNVVDLGTAGDVPFGFIDVCEQKISQDNLYANEVYVGVQCRGFREGIVAAASDIVGKVCVLDGTDVKEVNGAANIGVKQVIARKVLIEDAAVEGDIVVKVVSSASADLVTGVSKTVSVATAASAATIAGDIKTALSGETKISTYFDVTVEDDDVVTLTRNSKVANDGTLALTVANAVAATDTKVSFDTATTVPGVADQKVGVPIIINEETVGSDKFVTVFLG